MGTLIRLLAALACVATLAGCAALGGPRSASPALFDDSLFAEVQLPVRAADVTAPTPAMREYFRARIEPRLLRQDPRAALVDALYTRGDLGLLYDATATRTAGQAFDARAGNCLSLVLMTAAFAREAGLPVRFQSPRLDPVWAREERLLVSVGHVNVAIGQPESGRNVTRSSSEWLVIDFLPGQPSEAYRYEPIDEARVVAMFMNNRGAESLFDGRVDEAYAWTREALRADPSFAAAHNTLAVIYLRRSHAALAERALRAALSLEPAGVNVLANLVQALRVQGRDAEADEAARRLAALQPVAPYARFDEGQRALRAGRLDEARRLFEQELRDGADSHDVRHALAVVLAALGETRAAAAELRRAMEGSTTLDQQTRYALKLQRLESARAP